MVLRPRPVDFASSPADDAFRARVRAWLAGYRPARPERVPRDDASLACEFAHLLDWQRKLYAVVGFRPCGEIDLPPSLRDCKITNPDAPRLNYLIELQTDEGPAPVTPLFASITMPSVSTNRSPTSGASARIAAAA